MPRNIGDAASRNSSIYPEPSALRRDILEVCSANAHRTPGRPVSRSSLLYMIQKMIRWGRWSFRINMRAWLWRCGVNFRIPISPYRKIRLEVCGRAAFFLAREVGPEASLRRIRGPRVGWGPRLVQDENRHFENDQESDIRTKSMWIFGMGDILKSGAQASGLWALALITPHYQY